MIEYDLWNIEPKLFNDDVFELNRTNFLLSFLTRNKTRNNFEKWLISYYHRLNHIYYLSFMCKKWYKTNFQNFCLKCLWRNTELMCFFKIIYYNMKNFWILIHKHFKKLNKQMFNTINIGKQKNYLSNCWPLSCR